MPEKDTCGNCRFIGKLELIHICKNPKENSIPDAFEETLPAYPACDNFEPKDWPKDPLFKTGNLT